jgi:serine/threonine-protein kinase
MAQRTDALRDLILVVLALKNGLLDLGGLFAAFQAWDGVSELALTDVLVGQGVIDGRELSALEPLVAEHLTRRGGDPAGKLPTIGAGVRSVAEETLPDPDGPTDTVADVSRTLPGNGADYQLQEPRAAGPGWRDGPRFRVLRPHAQGGLGVVSVALDTELNREVALKQIKDRHADDPVSRSRFLLEAEVTGGLEHPGIVPVYGLGFDDDGRPYYAMRFIRGDSLADAIARFHADEALRRDPAARSLELRKLLLRFLDVCDTIGYAHGRGVLHRDLKPANVMVGRFGETLVVDWGIAKAVGRPDLEAADAERALVPKWATGATETLPGSTLGTPAYMSPEQAAGDLERMGPRSDVYSLGATLYCLLTGMPPFQDGDVWSVLRAVERGEFPPPRKLDREVDPALEAVCLKAMALKPEGRYPSPRALAEDVERWMADEPVSARPAPPSERLRRWMRRRRTAVTAAAAAALAALAGLVVVLVVQSRANHDLRLANAREARANQDLRAANERERQRFDLAMEAVRTFHTGVSEDLLLRQKEFAELRTKLLRKAEEFYRRLESLLQREADRTSRAALGRAHFELGELTSVIGSVPDALATHRQALALRQRLAREPGAGAEPLADVGRSLLAIARLEKETGGVAGAEKDLVEARDTLEGLARDPRTAPRVLPDLARAHHQLGRLLEDTGRPAEAMASYQKALEIRRSLAEAEPSNSRHQADLAAVLTAIGHLQSQNGQADQAMASYQKALEIREALTRSDPASTAYRIDLARVLHNIAVLDSRIGRTDDALAAYRKSLDIREALARTSPALTLLQSDLAAVLSDLAIELYRTGRVEQALASYERARGIERGLVNANPSVSRYQRNLALSDFAIGRMLAESGRTAEAFDTYAEARDILRALAQASPTEPQYRYFLAKTSDEIGGLLADQGRPDEALAAYERSRELFEALVNANPTDTRFRVDLSSSLASIGPVLARRGRADNALAALRRAREIQQALAAGSPSSTESRAALATSDTRLGVLLTETGRPAEAREALERAHRTWEELARAHPDVVEYQRGLELSHRGLGELSERTGQPAEAAGDFEQARAIAEGVATAHPGVPLYRARLASSERRLGASRERAGRPADAAACYRRAAGLLEALPHLGAGDLFSLARARAALAGLAGAEGSGVSASEGRSEADRAMDALRRAVADGYHDPDEVRTTSDLDPLRARPDFRLLTLDLAFPADPFAR